MDKNKHCCNICGKELPWDNLIWINSSFGVCEHCHGKIPQHINEKIQDEDYDEETRQFLDNLGANY